MSFFAGSHMTQSDPHSKSTIRVTGAPHMRYISPVDEETAKHYPKPAYAAILAAKQAEQAAQAESQQALSPEMAATAPAPAYAQRPVYGGSSAAASSSAAAAIPAHRRAPLTRGAPSQLEHGASIEESKIARWDPVEWNKEKLPSARIRFGWRGTLSGFSHPGAKAKKGVREDLRVFNLSGDAFWENFVVSDTEAAAHMSHVMISIHEVRQDTRTISVLTIDVDQFSSTLPFPVGVRCGENFFNRTCVPGQGDFMFVIPPNSKGCSKIENVVDVRKVMAPDRGRSILSIDMGAIETQYTLYQQDGQLVANIRKGSKLEMILKAFSEKETTSKRALDIQLSSSKLCAEMSKTKNLSVKEGATWYTALVAEPLQEVLAFIEEQSKLFPRCDSIELTLVPLDGAKWTDPSTWLYKNLAYAGVHSDAYLEPSSGASSSSSRSPPVTVYKHGVDLTLTFTFL